MKIGPVYSTDKFSYDDENRVFNAFASDLSRDWFMGPLFDDACDFGLWLKSEKTGKELAFNYLDKKVANNGEIQHWKLGTYDSKVPHSNFTMIVWND